MTLDGNCPLRVQRLQKVSGKTVFKINKTGFPDTSHTKFLKENCQPWNPKMQLGFGTQHFITFGKALGCVKWWLMILSIAVLLTGVLVG